MKIKKGDRVRVLTGKDRGKEGVVMFALPSVGKVIVEGVNVAKKHQKPTRVTMQGGIIDKDMPLDVSNVAIICPKDGATRVGYRVSDNGEKARVCRKCGQEL
jgi:large subunit ribosomal protein L24